MKISVIIPVFNVEKYIAECVGSVLKQTYTQMEVILIDDGSSDRSPQICDDFAEKDKRVKVIHKKNGGLSDARNAGIKAATGEYVLFLDGDDFWDDTTAIARIVDRVIITKTDVLNFSYKKYFEDSNEKVPYFKEIASMPSDFGDKRQQLKFLTDRGLYIASACNKLVKKTLFDEKMYFREGVYSEDIEWCAKLLVYAKSLDFICENFYCYRQRKTSITHTINKKKCDDLCDNIMKSLQIVDQSKEDEKKYIKRYVAFQYGTFFKVQAQSSEFPEKDVRVLAEYKWILSFHYGNKKLWLLNLSSHIIGYINTCRIIRYIIQCRKR